MYGDDHKSDNAGLRAFFQISITSCECCIHGGLMRVSEQLETTSQLQATQPAVAESNNMPGWPPMAWWMMAPGEQHPRGFGP
jgi:hypothetical protein